MPPHIEDGSTIASWPGDDEVIAALRTLVLAGTATDGPEPEALGAKIRGTPDGDALFKHADATVGLVLRVCNGLDGPDGDGRDAFGLKPLEDVA